MIIKAFKACGNGLRKFATSASAYTVAIRYQTVMIEKGTHGIKTPNSNKEIKTRSKVEALIFPRPLHVY
jgi:hypothetical protein